MVILLLSFVKFPLSGITWVRGNYVIMVFIALFLVKGLFQILFDKKSLEENCMNLLVLGNQKRRFYFGFRRILWLWNQHVVTWGWFSSWPLKIWETLLSTFYFLCLLCITATEPLSAQWELQGSHSSRIQSISTWILCCRLCLFCGDIKHMQIWDLV